jgi:hypothetical protein
MLRALSQRATGRSTFFGFEVSAHDAHPGRLWMRDRAVAAARRREIARHDCFGPVDGRPAAARAGLRVSGALAHPYRSSARRDPAYGRGTLHWVIECARSSVGQSTGLLSRGSKVRVLPGAPLRFATWPRRGCPPSRGASLHSAPAGTSPSSRSFSAPSGVPGPPADTPDDGGRQRHLDGHRPRLRSLGHRP